MTASRRSAGRLARLALALTLALGALLALAASSALAAAQPAIESASAVEVTSDSATLRALINPREAETSYYFEYGAESCAAHPSACTDLPAAPGAPVGEGAEGLGVSVLANKLAPSTTYHYRVVAINEAGTSESTEQTYTTQSTNTAFGLPNGRMWEMVTPPNKQGADLTAVGNEQGADIQAAEDGSAITYGATAPFVENPSGSAVLEVTQVFSRRLSPGAWNTQDITTAHNEGGNAVALGHSAEYKLFSTNLELGAVEPSGHTPLPPLPAGSEKTIYLRTAGGEYVALVTAANVRPGAAFGGNEENGGGVQFVSATPDFSHVVISASEVQLTETPVLSSEGPYGLYMWTAGHLELVSILPDGEGISGQLGSRSNEVRHAISDDGSRVIWSNGLFGEHLYMRDIAAKETIQVDAAQGVAEPGGASSQYQTANVTGSRIFFLSSQKLTPNATATGRYQEDDLYEFEVTSVPGAPLAGKLTDLTAYTKAGEEAKVQAVVEASADGSYVYFVADGALTAGAEAGAPNLYGEHFDQGSGAWEAPRLVATLSASDRPDWGAFEGANDLARLTARVSPNGRYLAFMSDRRLTGYDNLDARSGEPDEEVFLYDDATGKLVCASCNATGAQPIGIHEGNFYEERLVDYAQNWSGQWLAANIPGWDSKDLTSALYQTRYLSNSGRLFFNSSDALVPADVNGTEDVYEYEPEGVGSCAPPTYGEDGSIVHSKALGGCVALISAGTSAEESAFMDASASGSDVFFQTAAKLEPQDQDKGYDIYDAHECSEASPCAPPQASVPPPCTSTDACREAPQQQPVIFGAPASAAFSGLGNLTPLTQPKSGESRTHGTSRALKRAIARCRTKYSRSDRKRRRCEQRVRRRFRTARRATFAHRHDERGAQEARTSSTHTSGRRGR